MLDPRTGVVMSKLTQARLRLTGVHPGVRERVLLLRPAEYRRVVALSTESHWIT